MEPHALTQNSQDSADENTQELLEGLVDTMNALKQKSCAATKAKKDSEERVEELRDE